MNRHAIYALTLSMLIGIGATSCTKYNEVDPPRTDQKSTDELPLPTHTISQLKALYKRGGTLIDKPIVISAVIASDDSEGAARGILHCREVPAVHLIEAIPIDIADVGV